MKHFYCQMGFGFGRKSGSRLEPQGKGWCSTADIFEQAKSRKTLRSMGHVEEGE